MNQARRGGPDISSSHLDQSVLARGERDPGGRSRDLAICSGFGVDKLVHVTRAAMGDIAKRKKIFALAASFICGPSTSTCPA